jgi:Chaperone of endosialidase
MKGNEIMKNRNFIFTTVLLALGFFAVRPAPNAFGVTPAPDGGYANGNTAEGQNALFSLTTGVYNTANGYAALYHNIGNANTATGFDALSSNTVGHNNIALGFQAGLGVTTASNVTCIGAAGNNVSNSCYIGNIFGATSSNGIAVLVNSNGRLGTMTSSARFKDEIKPMDNASQALFALKPVTFRYKKDIDPAGTPQLGLVAEEVEKVNPDLVVRDKEGKPYSVRYDQVNAMLLNEFLKEHCKVEEQETTIAQLKSTVAKQQAGAANQETAIRLEQKEIQTLTTSLKEQAVQIQKVSAQVQLGKFATRRIRRGGPVAQTLASDQ